GGQQAVPARPRAPEGGALRAGTGVPALRALGLVRLVGRDPAVAVLVERLPLGVGARELLARDLPVLVAVHRGEERREAARARGGEAPVAALVEAREHLGAADPLFLRDLAVAVLVRLLELRGSLLGRRHLAAHELPALGEVRHREDAVLVAVEALEGCLPLVL